MDDGQSIQDLKNKVQAFCEERDWDQFHNPKDLAIGLITEASELLELFRFKNELEALEILNDPKSRVRVSEELSDVFFFLLRFARRFDFDLSSGLDQKMKKNAEKYPVELSRGKNKKYTELKDE